MMVDQRPGVTRRQLIATAAAATIAVLDNCARAADHDHKLASISLFADIAAPVIPPGTKLVRTQGYYASGEGAAEYIQDDTLDDGYIRQHRSSAFAAADGRFFRLRIGAVVDPRSLGLRTGLGRSFAPANRQAITDALELSKSMILPAGDIDLTGTGALGIPARDGIMITGQGWRTRLVTSDTAFMLPTLSRLEIRDLWIEQTRTSSAAIQSFHANLRDIRLIRLKITMRDQAECHNNCVSFVMDNSPVGSDGVIGLDGLLIEDCWLAPGRMGVELQNHRAGDDKRKLYGYRNIIVRGCTVWKAPAIAGMGVSLSGWGTDCLISRNRFIGCQGPNVEIVGGDRTTVADNVFEDAIGPLVTASNSRVVSGCRILQNRTEGKPPPSPLFLQAVDGAEVANNRFSSTGVAVIKGANVHIHDNVFNGVGTGQLIQLDNARLAVIEKNRFMSNGNAPPQAMIIAFNDTRGCIVRFNQMECTSYDIHRDNLWFFQAAPARGSIAYGNGRRGRGQSLTEPVPPRRGHAG